LVVAAKREVRVNGRLIQRMDELQEADLLALNWIAMQDLLEKLERQTPKGEDLQLELQSTSLKTIVNDNFVLPDGTSFSPGWIKCDLFNDGPDPTYFAFNGSATLGIATLNPGNMYVEDLLEPRIVSLTVWTAANRTANLRAFFKR
jgi:hypothetical protein